MHEESFSSVFHATDKKVKAPPAHKADREESQSQAAQSQQSTQGAQGAPGHSNREPASSTAAPAKTTRQTPEEQETPVQSVGMPKQEAAPETDIDLSLIMKHLNLSEADMPPIFKLGEASTSPIISSLSPLLASSEKTAFSTITPWRLPAMALDHQALESKIVDQVIHKLSLRQADLNGKGGVTLELEPKELGLLKVDISVNKGGVSAEILTHHPAVKEIIEKNQSLLQDALSHAGFNVDQFSVNVGDFQNHRDSDAPWSGSQFLAGGGRGFSPSPLMAAIGEAVRSRFSPEGAVSLYV